MSELRKPVLTMLLKKEGKKNSYKIELFRAQDWDKTRSSRRFRIRVNGVWFPKKQVSFFYKTEFMALLAKSISL